MGLIELEEKNSLLEQIDMISFDLDTTSARRANAIREKEEELWMERPLAIGIL